jgi:ribonuclease BN (tRNA processing enzyme)
VLGGGSSAVLTIVGAGTCVPDGSRHSAAFHLGLRASSVLLDCGPGTLHGLAERRIAWAELSHVIVSHYHLDHVGDLSAVLFALKNAVRPRRASPLTLVGPIGFTRFLSRLAEALGDHLLHPGFEVRVVELAPGTEFVEPGADFRVEACDTPHADESLAYRISGAWGALGYTGDTGPSRDVSTFLARCDVLVAECAHAESTADGKHLSPVLLAELAVVAAPALLVVTHVYPPLSPEDAVRRVLEGYAGRVVAGADGMTVRLQVGEPPAIDPPPSAR